MMPRNQRQEALCRTYVRAVAAQAGLIGCQPEPDFGIDLCLRSIALVNNRRRDSGVQIDLQLKSTARAAIKGAEVLYDLEVEAYNDLRAENCPCPRILVVFVMPEDETQWLEQSAEQLVLRHCAYWLSLRGLPPTPAVSTIRLGLPLGNVFSVEGVTRLMQDVAERSQK